jgi:flagellar biosynthetic protein FliQ
MTLVFIPKMLGVGIALLICFPWMVQVIVDFTRNLLNSIPMYVR